MAFNRPAPTQLRDRIAADFDGLFPGADPRKRRSVEGVFVRSLALVSHELHGHLAWGARQMHIATCDVDGVQERASIWGITRNQAVAAKGAVTIQGTAGRVVPVGTEMRRSDDARYATDADAIIGIGGMVTVAVTAATAGATGNAIAGTVLALIEPIDGVQSAVTVAVGGLGGGLDIEKLESLRARTSERIQEPPAGGAEHDYRAWVKDVLGDTSVWVQRATPAPGWVTVLFLMPDGSIPDAGTVSDVAAYIETRRPVTATGIVVAAPLLHLVDFTIGLAPDTVAARTAVLAEIDDLFVREAKPSGTIANSRARAAISSAVGEDSHTMPVPAGDIVAPTNHIARRGTVTWL